MRCRFVTSVVASLLLVASASSQKFGAVQKQAKAAVRALDVDPASGEQAVAAIGALGQFDTRRCVQLLLDLAEALDGRRTELADKRRDGLLQVGGSGRLKRSRYELRNIDDALDAVSRALAQLRGVESLQAMLKRLLQRGSSLPLWLRLELAARIGELPEDELDWRTPKGGKRNKGAARDALLAMLSVTASLGPRVAATSGGWLLQQLRHDNQDVRIAAIGALSKLQWPAAIEPLVARLADERGPVLEALLDALVVITGAHPGDSHGSWQAWLQAEGAPFLQGQRPLGAGDPGLRRRARKDDKTAAGTYFGIPQDGESILYLIDNSLSMRARMGRTKAEKEERDERRWEYCKKELKRALEALPANRRINLVSFANKARYFDTEMVPATPANIARAIAWVDELQLEFETNIYDALELASLIAGRGVADRYYESEVDTIFFLSDGAPTIPNLSKRGIGQDDPVRVLRAVRRWNVLRRVRIHTVGIGLVDHKDKTHDERGRMHADVFLKKLAEQNGGLYTGRR